MATKYFTGRATDVAQVSTATITAYDVATTYAIIIGGVTVSVIGQGGTVATTATALRTALNASTHPYFSTITWSGSSADITGTADTAGVPFTATTSETAGTGTIGDFSTTTASAGPSHLDVATNWSDGAVPGNDDTIIFADLSVNVLFGLGGLSATGLKLRIHQSYTGKIGLPWDLFTTDSAGSTSATAALEYREGYFSADFASVEIGEQTGPSTPAGSPRIKIHNDRASASTTTVMRTHATGESNKPAVRLKFDDDDAALYVQSAAGGLGLAADKPGETSSVALVSISDTTTASRIIIGAGVTFKATTGTYIQSGGTNFLSAIAAGTIAIVEVNGGSVTVFGPFLIALLTLTAGTVYSNNAPASGAAITTANISGGELNGQNYSAARTWTTVSIIEGTGVLKADDWITITTLNKPTGKFTLTRT